MPYGLIGSARNAAKGASRKTREGIPQVPIEELLAQVRGPAGALAKAGQGLAGPSQPDNVIAPMPADPAMLDPMAPKPAMMRGGVNKPAGLIGGSAPMQPAAPIVPGGQTRTREQAKQSGLIGSSAPKPQGGFLEMFGYDPEGTGMQPLDWLFSSREDVEAARGRKAAQEQKQRFAASLDQLQLSPQDRVRAEMDPEGFFRAMNEAKAAQMKPQTDTFYDPVSKQWMRKPLGPMAVAEGTDLVDPDTKTALYSNDKAPASQNLPEGMWYGPDGKGPPQPIPGYVDMRARIAAAGRAPSAGGDTYRPATPEDRAKWGLPPEGAFKINERTGEPAAISGARAAQDFSPTEVRGFRDKADGLLILKNAVQQYVDAVKETSPKLIADPWDQAGVQKLKTAHGLITSAIKQADTLGALDQGVQNLVNAIIADPVGLGTFGKDAKSIEEGARQLYSSIDFKLSRVPEEYRFGSTGKLPPDEAPAQPNPTFFSQQAQRMAQMGGAQPQPRQPVAQFNAPREAVQELMADPSPEAMAEFDDAFGTGAAEAALNGR